MSARIACREARPWGAGVVRAAHVEIVYVTAYQPSGHPVRHTSPQPSRARADTTRQP